MSQVIDEVTLTNPIIEENKPNQVMRLFITQVVENGLIIGTGTPETNVAANQGRTYMDDDTGASEIFYIKQQAAIGGDAKQGWRVIG